MKKIVVSSLKGGVGKTTLSIYLSMSYARAGYRTLVIDADPNNNLTDFFLRDEPVENLTERNLFRVLKGYCSAKEAVFPGPSGLEILPATPDLARAQGDLYGDPGAIVRFADDLSGMGFDVVVIDTPPSIGFELSLSLYKTDSVLCPVGFSRWTLQGFDLVREESLKARGPEPLAVPMSVTVKDFERLSELGLQMAEHWIPKNAAFARSAIVGKVLPESSDLWRPFDGLRGEI